MHVVLVLLVTSGIPAEHFNGELARGVNAGRFDGWLLAQAPDSSSPGFDVITTKDGKVHTGKIVRETSTGYLFKAANDDARVIPFAEIVDIQSTKPSQRSAPTVTQPPPAVHASPLANLGNIKRLQTRLVDLEC